MATKKQQKDEPETDLMQATLDDTGEIPAVHGKKRGRFKAGLLRLGLPAAPSQTEVTWLGLLLALLVIVAVFIPGVVGFVFKWITFALACTDIIVALVVILHG